MKRLLSATGLLALILIAASCTSRNKPSSSPESSNQSGVTIGLVLDRGGRDDKSFNSAAYAGAQKAAKELGIVVKDVESGDNAAFEPALRALAERGCPLVIAIGFSQKDALAKVAPQFPKTHFAIVDATVDGPNIQSLLFNEHEGSFLVGYLAGLFSKTGIAGFVGGMDIAMIRRFETGFEAGFKHARKDGKVLTNYVGVTAEAWANPNRAKELAIEQYKKKADVIFTAAGASSLGVFDAAEETKKYAIGVDSNQNGIKPGLIITSMLKRVDVAVYNAIQSEIQKKFQPGTKYFSLADQGVDYALDSNNEQIVAPFKSKVESVKSEIIAGKIKVPDYYQLRKTE